MSVLDSRGMKRLMFDLVAAVLALMATALPLAALQCAIECESHDGASAAAPICHHERGSVSGAEIHAAAPSCGQDHNPDASILTASRFVGSPLDMCVHVVPLSLSEPESHAAWPGWTPAATSPPASFFELARPLRI